MADWNLDNAAHLLRRAAFGGSAEDIQDFFDDHGSVASAVEELLSFKPLPKKPPPKKDDSDESKLKMQRWWLKQMVKSKPADSSREKLVLFFHNFLASGASRQPELRYMSWQNRLFRLRGKGSFKDLIREFNRDPANLYYLDGILNEASSDGIAVNANENFGREILELFTLGVFQFASNGTDDPSKPNYTEDDVHQLSRALTGWTDIVGELGVWNQDDWDGGQYDDDGDGLPDDVVIFGVTNNNFRIDEAVAGTPDDVLELIFARTDDEANNQVAMFVARKVWEWYAYPPPEAGLKDTLEELASAFVGSGFNMEELLRTAWNHDKFYSDAAKSRTVKSPVDYMVQTFKALGVKSNGKSLGQTRRELPERLADMGMDLFEPPNVAGWPGGLAWITSGTLFKRFEFAADLAAAESGSGRIKLKKMDALQFGNPATPVEDVVDQIVVQLGLDLGPLPLTSAQQDDLIDYAGGPGTTLDMSSDKTDDMETVRGIISLALQAAESQIF